MKAELLENIKKIPKLNNIKYVSSTLSLSQKALNVKFISDVAVDVNTQTLVKNIIKSAMPKSVFVTVDISKLVTQSEFVINSSVKYLKGKHAIMFGDLTENMIKVELASEQISVTLTLPEISYNYFNMTGVGENLKKYLQSCYIESFVVSAVPDENEGEIDYSDLDIKLTDKDIDFKEIRKLTVSDVTKLFDDDMTNKASYMADVREYYGELYLAGKVSAIREKISSNNKPFYIIDFSDGTGRASGAIFPNKDKIPKIKKLSEGSEIIVRGIYQNRDNYHNLRILSINLCVFPQNFVPIPRKSKSVSSEYYLIKPEKVILPKQVNLFQDTTPPKCFDGRSFVVFDFETTGTGFEDKITEIGAVKVENGIITESFETLINPERHIPLDVQEITHITDEMVSEAPLFKDVCSDFYKFCYGSTIVAHNIEFDARFLAIESKPLDYSFENMQMDTLALSREVFPNMPHHRLNDMCEHFNIELNHHRAASDAIATAQLFIELIRIKKELPF